MIDMKRKPEAKTMLAESEEADAPEYPYGLRISLDSESLAKIGITELPAIDAEFKITALACVVSVSQYESQGTDKSNRSVDLQIEMMELSPAKEESGEGRASPAQRRYSNSGMNP